jgi:hypothetical protein
VKDDQIGQPSIILPYGAGPNDPAIVISTEITPELQAWVTFWAPDVTLDAVIIYRRSATEYVWEGIGTFLTETTRWRGSYNPTFGVVVTQRTVVSPLNGISERFGSALNAAPVEVRIIGSTLFIIDQDIISGSHREIYRQNAPVGSTTSGAIDVYPGPQQLFVQKKAGPTKLDFEISGTCYAAVAADGVEFYVQDINSGIITPTTAAIRPANTLFGAHTQFFGRTLISGLPASFYTYQLMWRSTNAVNITTDNNDTLAFKVEEVS